MAKRRFPQDRRATDPRPLRRRKKKSSGSTPFRLSRFGRIPLVELTTCGDGGEVYRWLEPDPDYRPELPPGAVRGDVRRQVYCSTCHEPRYYFEDETRECIQCEAPFTFSGREQKHWYETLKFHFDSAPIRCLRCRRQRRSEKALRRAVAVATEATRSRPADPAGYLALARALVELRSRCGVGKIDAAVAAARKASRFWSGAPEPLYWEGLAQDLAGRRGKARERLSRCLDAAGAGPTAAGLVRSARRRLDETG